MEILVVVIYLGLLYLAYKIFSRYLIPAVLGAVVLGVIGAICTDGDTWHYFAYAGAALGLVVVLLVDFENAWKTILGALIGGLVGFGLSFLIGQGNMWSGVAFLACIIVGAAVCSAAALEDLFGDGPGADYVEKSPRKPEENRKWKDALGHEHEGYASNKCRDCAYYPITGGCTKYPGHAVSGYNNACSSFLSATP